MIAAQISGAIRASPRRTAYRAESQPYRSCPQYSKAAVRGGMKKRGGYMSKAPYLAPHEITATHRSGHADSDNFAHG